MSHVRRDPIHVAGLLAVLVLATSCARLGADGGGGRFERFSFPVDGAERTAVMWVPAAYDARDGDWPLVVFLHGLGERGDDARRHVEVGLGRAIDADPSRFPCLVLMPQCPRDSIWVDVDEGWAREFASAEAHVDAAFEEARRRYRVDEARVALTGLSMGGFGTFMHGAHRTDRYRRMVAVCGGGHPEDAPALARVPMWVLHGGADPVVPASYSRRMVDAIRAAGGDVRYTEYEGVGHNSWDRAYGDPEVIRFLIED